MAEEGIFYFDGSESLNSVLVGNASRNIKLIEKKLDVWGASRYPWVKIISGDSSALSRTASFIRDLISLHDEGGKSLLQLDFEQLLSAYRHHREKDTVFGVGPAVAGKT